MKTTEEILREEYKGKPYSFPKDKETLKAMEIYAKQEAIAFIRWQQNSDWHYIGDGKWFIPRMTEDERATSEQLYELFQQSKTTKTPS